MVDIHNLAIFKSQRRDLEVEFGSYAFGLVSIASVRYMYLSLILLQYEYMNKPSLLWAKRFKDKVFDEDDDSDLSGSDSDSDSDGSEDDSDGGDSSGDETSRETEKEGDKDGTKDTTPIEKKAIKPEDILCHPEDVIDYPPYDEPMDCRDYDGKLRIESGDIMYAIPKLPLCLLD